MPSSSRYQTLQGDRAHTPLASAFFQAADFKTGLAATAACYAVNSLILKSPDAVSLTIACALANTLNSGIVRLVENYFLFPQAGLDHKNKAIDTTPGQDTPPNSPDTKLKATRAYQFYQLYLGISLATDLILGANLQNAFSSVASYTRQFKGMMRFNRVANDHWAIIDTPPPQKVAETKEEKMPSMIRPQADMAP
jgi:hypothetical protein